VGRAAASPIQCPFGFTSFPIRDFGVVFTGLIPYPRLGGEAERARAKRYPDNKIPVSSMETAARGFAQAEGRIRDAETEVAKKQTVALHEIRKLNAKVKQTAERLCRGESPYDIDGASPELVRILKTSELMSYQFEVLELLANEGLASLPLNTESDVYRLFDKCVRIYQPEGKTDRISIRNTSGGTATVRVCDKTFPIVPSVLIENGIKHSLPDSQVHVEVRLERAGTCVISVASRCRSDVRLTAEIFDRGVRATTDVEGSGNGLYLAQLVARQHGTEIQLQTEPWGGDQRVMFMLRLSLVR
jgi:light-regulated signal transduction histidine kinase (bacteriophytochrome)